MSRREILFAREHAQMLADELRRAADTSDFSRVKIIAEKLVPMLRRFVFRDGAAANGRPDLSPVTMYGNE